MTHSMQIQPSLFEMIRDGTKTTGLRLFNEKRKQCIVYRVTPRQAQRLITETEAAE